jgi:hypothetical protein
VGLFAGALSRKAENRVQPSLLSQIRVTLLAIAGLPRASEPGYIRGYGLENALKSEKARFGASTPFHATAILGNIPSNATRRCGWSAGMLAF